MLLGSMGQLRMVYAMLLRETILVKKTFVDEMINSSVMIAILIFIFSQLAPLIGFAPDYVFITFLGTMTISVTVKNFSRAIEDMSDIARDGYILYRRTLPISKHMLVLSYVLSYAMSSVAATFPLLVIGSVSLHFYLGFKQANIFYALLVYLLMIFFMATFMVCFVFTLSYQWFIFNIWQRVLTPMMIGGGHVYAWKPVYAFSPYFATAMLFNPATYANEGMRSALSGSSQFIPATTCIAMLGFFLAVGLAVLFRFVVRRLDWV